MRGICRRARTSGPDRQVWHHDVGGCLHYTAGTALFLLLQATGALCPLDLYNP